MIPQAWSDRDTATAPRDFLGTSRLRYFDVTVRIKEIAANAIIVCDAPGSTKIVKREDMSFASWYIGEQNIGAIVLLKIRKWQ